ncbi:hypothetical protein [Promicromonospora sp. NPDC023987]|uniref:hypothetical protein n=1 Tax=Promicromonospora sp. NPDC023987 TaxID=3155360 RepID=UPI0033D9EE3A
MATSVSTLATDRSHSHTGTQPSCRVAGYLGSPPWVRDAAVRVWNQGRVFHVEAFVQPSAARSRWSSSTTRHEALHVWTGGS